MFPPNSKVTSYSFPIPIDSQNPGRIGYLRSGRMIYEFLDMTEDDIAAVAYKYTHVVKADIKSFYPSIYTHSIAWAIHGKKHVRKPANLHNFLLVGNRLDRLFKMQTMVARMESQLVRLFQISYLRLSHLLLTESLVRS